MVFVLSDTQSNKLKSTYIIIIYIAILCTVPTAYTIQEWVDTVGG